MSRFLDRLASLPIIFISGACEAQMVYVPCDLPIVAMAPVHFRPHPVKRVVAHRGGRRGVMRALHLVAGREMCAVWGEGLTDANLADDFDHAFGGGEPYFGGGGDFGGDEGAPGWFGGFGGGGGSDVGPLFLVETTPLTPDTPLIPITPIVPIAPITPPVPEPSTWAMFLAGLSAIGFLKWKRFA